MLEESFQQKSSGPRHDRNKDD